jgi:hypothetical protein
MAEFKVGDRVKLIDYFQDEKQGLKGYYHKFFDTCGTIEEISNLLYVLMDIDGTRICGVKERFIKVDDYNEPEREIKFLYGGLNNIFNKQIGERTEVKKFVKCWNCNKEHDPNSETFFTIVGNINVGKNGEIIRNNFDESGKLNRVMVY